jgi:dissimilatory sulfite reductase (desulfoviridin) alpha/beta subunit
MSGKVVFVLPTHNSQLSTLIPGVFMKWSKEAEEAVSKIPFFVRKRVKKRVEEEAARGNAKEVTWEHVQTCKKRFLNQMEEEVRGYQVETCFGPTGCPNRAVDWEISKRVEELLEKRNLKAFLKEKVQGPLKLHHEFRVSISDCPNACSRPQIADLGLIGARRPQISEEECIQCGACVETCREGAILLAGKWPVVDWRKCVSCGQCIPACPTRTLQEEGRGFRIQVGGKLGRHPRLAEELPGIHSLDETLEIIDRCLDHYQKYCRQGERFGEILERTGTKELVP